MNVVFSVLKLLKLFTAPVLLQRKMAAREQGSWLVQSQGAAYCTTALLGQQKQQRAGTCQGKRALPMGTRCSCFPQRLLHPAARAVYNQTSFLSTVQAEVWLMFPTTDSLKCTRYFQHLCAHAAGEALKIECGFSNRFEHLRPLCFFPAVPAELLTVFASFDKCYTSIQK